MILGWRVAVPDAEVGREIALAPQSSVKLHQIKHVIQEALPFDRSPGDGARGGRRGPVGPARWR